MPTASSSRGISAPAFPGIAYPLPKKKPGWEPLHLTFRHAALPRLPSIHSRAILAVMKCGAYEKPIPPSNHSIKTLAWMGDAVLYLAATKATLKAAVGGKNGQHLTAIRSGLTNNRTFSYLTSSYRIIAGFCPAHSGGNQKRYADFFEAYIGAAWISASETRDPEHITAIEEYLSKLFKPEIWPALESLLHGHVGSLNAVKIQQDLEGGSGFENGHDDVNDDGAGDVSVFDIPPPRASNAPGRQKTQVPGTKKQRLRIGQAAPHQHRGYRTNTHADRRWQAEASLHAHQLRAAISNNRSARSATLRSGSMREPIELYVPLAPVSADLDVSPAYLDQRLNTTRPALFFQAIEDDSRH